MKNKRIIDSWNKIEPDKTEQEQMLANILDMAHSGKNKKGDVNSMKNKKYWKILAPVAACFVVAVAITIPLLYNGGDVNIPDNGFSLLLSSGVTVSYTNDAPSMNSSGDLVPLTEEELFSETYNNYELVIFGGVVREVNNIVIDFNGRERYQAIAKIEVSESLRGNIALGDVVIVLLPAPVNMEGLRVEDTSVSSQITKGTTGIFMPIRYDETSIIEMNGATLVLSEIVEYGLLDGERWVFLETPEGLVFSRWAYGSIADVATMNEIRQYINEMITR